MQIRCRTCCSNYEPRDVRLEVSGGRVVVICPVCGAHQVRTST